MVEFTWLISTLGVPRLEEEPLRDLRVRRALYLAVDGKQVIEANPMGLGHGSPNPAVPAAIREWSIPIDQLPPEGRRLYEPDLPEAKRLLAQAGHGGGLRLPVESTAS